MVSFKNTFITLAMLVALGQALALPPAPKSQQGLTAVQKTAKTANIDSKKAKDADTIAKSTAAMAGRQKKETDNTKAQATERKKIAEEKAQIKKLEAEMGTNKAALGVDKARGAAFKAKDTADNANIEAARTDSARQDTRLARVNSAKLLPDN